MVGSSGGEYGIRGYVAALDADTGKEVWRTHMIPGPGEPGHETWKDGKERYKHGGASVWATGNYDVKTDTLYQGVGNAGPDYDTEYRPGDNKWAASVIAVNVPDGKIKWGFQYTPNDPYDFDEISEHTLVDLKIDGVEVEVEPAEAKDYDQALTTFRKGDFAAASLLFADFVRRYPNSPYLIASLFWLGNAQYATREYKAAIATFKSLIQAAPEHPRASESWLAVANCQIELKESKAARKSLEDLIKTHPSSEAAVAAKERLAKLK